MTLAIIPMTIKEAKVFVSEHHRHHKKVTGALFACGLAKDVTVCGVAICGRPVARGLQDGWTIEIIRCCTDGTRNACSMLYGACRRAALALGWKRVVTYTARIESGASLRAAGFRVVADVRGQSWNRPSRPRVDTEPAQHKLRWEAAA